MSDSVWHSSKLQKLEAPRLWKWVQFFLVFTSAQYTSKLYYVSKSFMTLGDLSSVRKISSLTTFKMCWSWIWLWPSLSLSELRELVMDREGWRAVIHGVAKSRTWLRDWTELTWCVVLTDLTILNSCNNKWILYYYYFHF